MLRLELDSPDPLPSTSSKCSAVAITSVSFPVPMLRQSTSVVQTLTRSTIHLTRRTSETMATPLPVHTPQVINAYITW